MRGWLSLLTCEGSPESYRTGLFIASAEPDVIVKAWPAAVARWWPVRFTILACQGYAQQFENKTEILWQEQLKRRPARSLLTLRKRKFDVCVVLLAGRPTFRKLKFAALLMNARRTVFYNENGDSIILDRRHWRQLVQHVAYRTGRSCPSSLFFPAGFVYLLVRTMWLVSRARFMVRKAHGNVH